MVAGLSWLSTTKRFPLFDQILPPQAYNLYTSGPHLLHPFERAKTTAGGALTSRTCSFRITKPCPPHTQAFNLYTSGGRPDRSGGSTTGRESLRNFSASNLTINATGMETVRNLTSSNFSASDFTLHGNAVGLETVRNLTLPATGLETAHNLIRSTPGRETASNFTPSGVPASGLEPSSVSNGHDSGREPASDSAGAKSSGREPASDTTGQDSGLDAAGSLGEGLPFLDAGSREKTRGFSGLDLGVEDAGGFSLAGDLPGEKFDKKLEPLGEKLEL
ncbi:hypothetical protein T484DRAFT_3213672 [Baffinella frigidus]|nr:hypothetical protein T484DRAFT_3213672 [Cryptophyta sp. CCMP2293]